MKFIVPFLYFLALTESLQAAPLLIPPELNEQISELPPWKVLLKSIRWRDFLPFVGGLAVFGTVAGIVALGRKADEMYEKHQAVKYVNDQTEFYQLPPEEQEYLKARFASSNAGDPKWDELDAARGYPTRKKPDINGLEPALRKDVEKAYKQSRKATEKAEDMAMLKKKFDEEDGKKVKIATVAAARVKDVFNEAMKNRPQEEQADW